MIIYPARTKEELNTLLNYEKSLYCPSESYKKHVLRHSKSYAIWNAVHKFRKYEFAILNNMYCPVIRLLLERKSNRLCESLGIELIPGRVEPGIKIYHNNVILNGYVGQNCIFHGNNMIGNKGTGQKDTVPHIGNRVDVGYGAVVIGDITIADDCVIGAGAVVTKSFLEPGSIIAGVPARLIDGAKV